jgi:hypothetical protein
MAYDNEFPWPLAASALGVDSDMLQWCARARRACALITYPCARRSGDPYPSANWGGYTYASLQFSGFSLQVRRVWMCVHNLCVRVCVHAH